MECYNCTIKEQVHSAHNIFFQYFLPVLIMELMYAQVFWRCMFALKGDISQTESPSELILYHKLDFNAHCKVEFGEYIKTREEHDKSMATHTIGAIAT